MLLTMRQSDTTLSGAHQRLDGELQHLEVGGVGDLDEAGPVEVRRRGVRVAEIQTRVLAEVDGVHNCAGMCAPISSFASMLRNGSERRQYAIGFMFLTTSA